MSRELIDRAREQIDAAWLSGDADGITRHLAEDAVLMPPHDAAIVGRQQINAWLRRFFEHFAMPELAMPERELILAGDWAFERSLYEWTITSKDGGEVMRDRANFMALWQRGPDGVWREVRGIWNSTLPLAVAQGST
jgi:uncharacterized protein (TIGR02246 family)